MTEQSSNSSSLFDTAWNDATEGDVAYTRLSICALLASFFGLASFFVFMSPWFFFFSVIGILLGLLAVKMIHDAEGTITGLLFAQFGLACSIISIIAVSILWPAYQYGVRKEADRFNRLWFQAVSEHNVPMAKGFNDMYWSRPKMETTEDEEKWWTSRYENRMSHRDLHRYLENDLLRTMLALGKSADVTYYKTLSVASLEDKDVVEMVYAVTYPVKGGSKETFFVKMTGQRMLPTGDTTTAGWSLTKAPEFYLPDSFKDVAKIPGEADLPTDLPKTVVTTPPTSTPETESPPAEQ